MSEFERATRLEQVNALHWIGQVDPDWGIVGVPNGGYIMSIGAKALSMALPHKDPLTISAYYLSKSESGPMDCHVEILRSGGSTSHGLVRLSQNGIARVQLLAVYTDRDQLNGVDHRTHQPPAVAPWDECIALPKMDNIPFMQKVTQKLEPSQAQNLKGQADQSGRWLGWIGFADGTDADLFSLLTFADGFPPPAFTLYGPTGWVPTLELTVQIRAEPASGPLQCLFKTEQITKGVLEEDGWLWDSEGRLVAISRQTARIRLPSDN